MNNETWDFFPSKVNPNSIGLSANFWERWGTHSVEVLESVFSTDFTIFVRYRQLGTIKIAQTWLLQILTHQVELYRWTLLCMLGPFIRKIPFISFHEYVFTVLFETSKSWNENVSNFFFIIDSQSKGAKELRGPFGASWGHPFCKFSENFFQLIPFRAATSTGHF